MASWGDEVVQDDFLPPRTEQGPDAQGIKTITEYRRKDGRIEKVVTRVKTVTVKSVINDQVRRRKKLARFGLALGNDENVTLQSVDEVHIEKPGRASDQDSAALVNALTAAISKRGNNAGGAASNDFWKKKRENFTGSNISATGTAAPGVFVPPHKRAGHSGSSSMNDRDSTPTLRVTNLSPDTKDLDVRELFNRFGRVTRVYLAKDKITGLSRGFAFVSFDSKKDAQTAMENLDRYPYDHLILRVEWAKPSVKKDPGASGGLSSSFTSGYGKALPQTAAARQQHVRR